MIGRIRGTLLERRPPWLVVDVNGVGYELEAPMSTFYALPAIGEGVELYTHLVVRDDAHLLYAFAAERDREMFRALIRVNGVGARLALAILSGMTADEFAACVQAGDAASLVRLPGIGKRTAERLLVELRDRASGWGTSGGGQPPAVPAGDPVADAVSALMALGYREAEAARAVAAVRAPGLDGEALIRQALRSLVRS